MISALKALDKRLGRLRRPAVLGLALLGVVGVGVADYLAGYEVAFSIFYVGPVAAAAWYSGWRHAVAVALASCISWYIADLGAGHAYSHPVIPVWNALVRLGFFLITGLLLVALRESLHLQRHLARTDGLTGLYSRREFEERLRHDIARARRHRTALTLAFVDLDDFKDINDARGHAEGDRALTIVGRALKLAVRETDTAARLGGDEFALVLPDTAGDGAQQAVEKAVAELLAALRAAGFAVSCSVGVVTFEEPPASAETAVAAADALMYEVKRRGKGAVSFSVMGALAAPRAEAEVST